MHPFAIDRQGQLFVDVGSATNSCQSNNRMPHSPGHEPCTELKTRGGIWRYDANKIDQMFSPAKRYATGIRNGEGIDFDAARAPVRRSTAAISSRRTGPSCTRRSRAGSAGRGVADVEKGGDYGWPRCYFDGRQKKLVLAPEYGGDGGRKIGACADKRAPARFFPAHWAPNDLLIYKARSSRRRYQGGAFIAFHGSWNRRRARRAATGRVPAALVGKASGDYIVRRWLRRRRDATRRREASPDRAGTRPGRGDLHQRRQGRARVEGHLWDLEPLIVCREACSTA